MNVIPAGIRGGHVKPMTVKKEPQMKMDKDRCAILRSNAIWIATSLCLTIQGVAAERPRFGGGNNYTPHPGTRAITVTPSSNPITAKSIML